MFISHFPRIGNVINLQTQGRVRESCCLEKDRFVINISAGVAVAAYKERKAACYWTYPGSSCPVGDQYASVTG